MYLIVLAVLSSFASSVVQLLPVGDGSSDRKERALRRGDRSWVRRAQKPEGQPSFQRETVVGMARGGEPAGKRLFKNEVTWGVYVALPGWSRESINVPGCYGNTQTGEGLEEQGPSSALPAFESPLNLLFVSCSPSDLLTC